MIDMFQEIDDYTSRALERQIEFFKGLLNWEKLLTIYANESQEVETVLIQFRDKLNAQFGVGTTLDVFGKIFKKARGNLTDDQYRNIILSAYAEFNRSGQIEVLISVYKSLVLANKIILREYVPATVIMEAQVDDVSTVITDFVRTQLNLVKAFGIDLDLTLSYTTGGFTIGSIIDNINPSLGLSSLLNPTMGGKLGSLV